MTQDIAISSGYTAALSGAALAAEDSAGRILMRGRDRAELLHRLSTNDIVALRPGQGARTVLTSPIGRIIDLLTVHALDDALLVVTSADQGAPVYSLLRKNIFFNDQVTLEPAGRSHGQLALYGPAATDMLGQVFGAFDTPALHGITRVAFDGTEVWLARRLPLGGPSFTLFVPQPQVDALRHTLVAAGAAQLDRDSFDQLRIEQGYGTFGHELSLEYIPLETGLLDAISFTKGCYVGQEIIARMESRGRLAKQLRGLRLDGLPAAPAKLEIDGKEAGDLTSAIVSPRFGPIALAYVRSAHATPDTRLQITGSAISGVVVELPFAME
ncbi:MAG TPA: glycine cleavage T C-terminal barrel domain-containing protein [Roseiflexaceae bacterium]|nr:glycine cleavage T C-terminal barrel domain-containing protein [Roseiflexaceae bacterium]